jgi:hypothetical protein
MIDEIKSEIATKVGVDPAQCMVRVIRRDNDGNPIRVRFCGPDGEDYYTSSPTTRRNKFTFQWRKDN